MGLDIEVDPGDLRSHASVVGTVQSRVSGAATAAESTLDMSAFGVVNGFLAAAVTGFAGDLRTRIAHQADDLGHTAATLRAMAANQEGTDHDSGATIRSAAR